MSRTFWSYCFCLIAFAVTGTAVVFVVYWVFTSQWHWQEVVLFASFYFAMMSTISVGWHRYLTHGSFEFTRVGYWIARPFVLIIPCFTWQSTPLFWCATHTSHHEHADTEDDPHTPQCKTGRWWHYVGQFFWVQGGFWVPYAKPNIPAFCRRPQVDWLVRFLSNWYVYLLVGAGLPLGIAWCVGGVRGMVWYLACVFVTWHLTQAVNSVTHLVGYRRFATHDHSTNVLLLAPLTFGEGWHNGHHAFAKSPRLAHGWWEILFDIGWLEILFLRMLGLVRKLRVPTHAQLTTKAA